MEPFNVEAMAKLRQCDEMIKTWSKSGVKPEQFTGEKAKNILSREELEGGYNAWLRKVCSSPLLPGVLEAHQGKGAAFSCGAPCPALLMTAPLTNCSQ